MAKVSMPDHIYKRKTSGYVVIVKVAILALTAVLGYFAVPRVVADIKMRRATRQATQTAAAATKADEGEKSASVNTGRAIQREATQAASALSLLPSSPQINFASDRLVNIGLLSNQLFGPAPADDSAKWQKLALDSFAETKSVRDAAEKEIAAQQATINQTIAQLEAAQKAKAEADARSQRAIVALNAAQEQLDHANGFAAMLKFILTCLAVLGAAAVAVSLLASHFPDFAPAATALHAIFAPGAALLLKKAKDDGRAAIEKAGEFFGRVRAEMPAEADRIRAIGNQVFDGVHKDVIGPIAEEVHKAALLARAEAEKLVGAKS
jgi:hypothetical protein